MPGILGIIRTGNARQTGTQLKDMVKCMMREPFYSSGTLLNESLGLGAGWVCHPRSFSDCLPSWNEDGNVALLLAGEACSDPGQLNELKEKGHRFDSGNGGYLVHLYEEFGLDFLSRLNGVCSGLILDLRERKLVLFNDRYGLGRIYFHQNKDGFYFASEAKALLQVLPQLRRLDPRGFAEFFSCGCVLQNRTLSQSVELLPPASAWTFRPQTEVERASYFRPDRWEEQETLPVAEYYEQLKETFTRILPGYLRGGKDVALSLTGGLDSRMIIAAAHAPPSSLTCYTFGGMYRECADVRIAREVAARCGQPHTVIPVDQSFFASFPALAGQSVAGTDGAMDVTGAVELFVNMKAREIAPVRLTGNYGDEVLRGNVAFKPESLCPGLFEGEFDRRVRVTAETYAAEKQGRRLSFIAFKQVPWHHYCRLALEQSQIVMRSPFLDNEMVALAYRAPEGLSLNRDLAYRFAAESAPALAGLPTDRGLGFKPRILPAKFWESAREFMPRAEYAYDYGMPQWLAKVDRALAPLRLERFFLGRQKFYHFRTWYRHELAPYVQEVLLDARTLGRPYLNGRRVEQIVRAHTSGRGNYTREIHKLLSSEILQRQLVEGN